MLLPDPCCTAPRAPPAGACLPRQLRARGLGRSQLHGAADDGGPVGGRLPPHRLPQRGAARLPVPWRVGAARHAACVRSLRPALFRQAGKHSFLLARPLRNACQVRQWQARCRIICRAMLGAGSGSVHSAGVSAGSPQSSMPRAPHTGCCLWRAAAQSGATNRTTAGPAGSSAPCACCWLRTAAWRLVLLALPQAWPHCRLSSCTWSSRRLHGRCLLGATR